MTRIRKIQPEEIPALHEKFKAKWPWAAEPAWAGVRVLERDGEIVGFVGFQVRLLVEPLFAETPYDALLLMVHADARMGDQDYEFFVADENEAFGKTIEKHFGIKGYREIPGKVYQVRQGVAYGQRRQPKPSGSTQLASPAAITGTDAEGLCATGEYLESDTPVCANAD